MLRNAATTSDRFQARLCRTCVSATCLQPAWPGPIWSRTRQLNPFRYRTITNRRACRAGTIIRSGKATAACCSRQHVSARWPLYIDVLQIRCFLNDASKNQKLLEERFIARFHTESVEQHQKMRPVCCLFCVQIKMVVTCAIRNGVPVIG